MFKTNFIKTSHFSQGFVALFSGRMLQYAGYSLIGIFLPIYIFIALGEKIELVLWYFLIGHLAYALILPWGAGYLNKIGLKRSLRISVFMFALYYLFLYLLNYNIFWFVFLSLFFLTLGRTMFWMPFHTDMAKFTNLHNRGKSISLMWATKIMLSVIMPLLGGLLIRYFNYSSVFAIAITVYITALIPFAALPHTHEKYTWSYFATFRHFFAKKNRKLVFANMANGAENAVGIIIWPIFIWQLLEGNFVAVGLVSSMIIFVTIIMELAVGKYTDIFDKRKIIHWGSTFYALGWLAKIFVFTSLQIFMVGAYHSFAQIFKDTPFDALNYELMADQGHYVDEYTVIKEIAVQTGKVLMLIFAIIVAINYGLNWTFALAAVASIFVNII